MSTALSKFTSPQSVVICHARTGSPPLMPQTSGRKASPISFSVSSERSSSKVLPTVLSVLSPTEVFAVSKKQFVNVLSYVVSPALEYICAFFCFLSGVNFTLLYAAVIKFKIKDLFKNSEFKFYMLLVTAFTAFIMVELIAMRNYDVEHAFRSSIFQVVSFITTTGLFNDDAAVWPHVTWVVLAACMFFGACSGSTSGGLKCIRGVMLVRMVKNEFRQILHPNAVLPLKIDGVNVPMQKRVTLLAFLTTYLIICLVISFTMIAMGIDNTNAITITLSCVGNVGPTLGTEIGPTMSWSELPDVAKWFCSLMMLIGRLEIFSVLVILTPAFWREN